MAIRLRRHFLLAVPFRPAQRVPNNIVDELSLIPRAALRIKKARIAWWCDNPATVAAGPNSHQEENTA